MLIRPETIGDYAAIADVHVQAFGNHALEALIVSQLRNRPQFDPELSLVAEVDGKVVGHVLFSPYAVQFLGETVSTVNLAPIGVYPAYQGRRVGARLIQAGHDIARAKGYKLSFLVGHPTYYPRLGYKTRAYGVASLTLPVEAIESFVSAELTARTPEPEDVKALHELWFREEHLVDFALDPGSMLLDWLSPSPSVETLVFLREGHVAGYTRTNTKKPDRPIVFLAHDDQAAYAMVSHIYHKSVEAGPPPPEITLPLHPLSTSTPALGTSTVRTFDAAMAYPLTSSPLDEYYARAQSGEHPAGRLTWPSIFDE